MRIYKNGEITIPQDLNLTELLHRSAGKELVDSHLVAKDSLTNRSLTIGELRSRAGRIANGLQRHYHPPDQSRWAIILPNSVDFVELFHAVLWLGGAACPINHALNAAEIGHALTSSRPHYVLAYGPALEKVLQAVEAAERHFVETSVVWERPAVITVIQKSPGYKHLPDDFLAETTLPIPHYPDTSTRLASIHLSSGTTGKPKGVELSHLNYVANCYQLYHHDPPQWQASLRHVAYTPYVHIAQTMPAVFFGPWTGMMYHAMPSFDLETYGKLVESNQATNHLAVPSIALMLATSDITRKYDFSQSRFLTVGQLSMDGAQMSNLLSRAPWRLSTLYGMTEAAPYIAYQKAHQDLPVGVTGQLLPNIEVVLKDEDGNDAPAGGPGELWVRGPNVTRGYAFNAAATAAAFPLPGWYNTGDVCTISAAEGGWLSVVGRTKELIKYQGFQVSPVELETHINAHPLVADAAVAARLDPTRTNELPTGYVVLHHDPLLGARPDADRRAALRDIHAAVDALVSGYKKLRGGVWEVTELPRNPTGKLLRAKLHDYRTGLCSLDEENRLARL